jgi:putative selenium metabolism hydrolase
MVDDLAHKVLESARAEKEYVADLLQRLIRIPSPSGREGDAVRLVADEMGRLGPDEVFVDAIGSAVARFGSGSRVIVYDSHLDTVGIGDPASWKADPFAAARRGGVIYGRGASDNKAGVACMVTGLKIIAALAARSDFTLYVVGIVQEEDCEGLALSVLLEDRAITPAVVVLGECTDLGVSRGQRGRTEIEVVTRGKSCHASSPERGKNAIYRMTPVVEGIKWLQRDLGSDPFLGKATIAVTSIECATPSRNAVPDMCRIYIDRRLVPEDTRDTVASEIDRIAKFTEGEVSITRYKAPSYKGFVREREKFFPAWKVEEDCPAVTAAVETATRLLGGKPQVGRWDFSTDGTYSMGVKEIPTIGFGPGQERHVHSAEDQVKVEDLWKAAAFYALFPFIYAG